MYKAANARLLLRSLSPNSAALASVNPGRAASSARLALSLPCGAWVGRSGLVRRAAAFSGTRPRFAGARAQIGAAVPAVEQFQRRMATQGACVRARACLRPSARGVFRLVVGRVLVTRARGGAIWVTLMRAPRLVAFAASSAVCSLVLDWDPGQSTALSFYPDH